MTIVASISNTGKFQVVEINESNTHSNASVKSTGVLNAIEIIEIGADPAYNESTNIRIESSGKVFANEFSEV